MSVSSAQTGQLPADCLSCRIIGTGALGTVGVYALNQSRAHQPGSLVGKRILAGVGVLFLVGSIVRWKSFREDRGTCVCHCQASSFFPSSNFWLICTGALPRRSMMHSPSRVVLDDVAVGTMQ
ncbi:hypothetical protein BV25DRAFT_1797717 [Artomyces pyxidatus]|uniref:Uncharacterized protein n=1 Tax=Artomyces pyxidatus TaxID=48021 RepID=A0ACB8TB25_9AGAM|nr:hypothetical protein BV25DRAFT_1797717 [Artomyces pyxidatus]